MPNLPDLATQPPPAPSGRIALDDRKPGGVMKLVATASGSGDADDVRVCRVPVDWRDEEAARHLPQEMRVSLAGPRGAPLIVALGGISGNADVVLHEDGAPGWWHGLFAGRALSRERYRVLGIDFAADETGEFAPRPADQADIVAAALAWLGEAEPFAIVGASYGGMVAMAYAERYPCRSRLVIISADDRPHPWATAIRGIQREIVALGLSGGEPERAQALARGLGMMTYRTRAEFGARFRGGTEGPGTDARSEPGEYLKARGAAFLSAMAPTRFLSLSASLDRQDVDVAQIANRCLLIGVEEDALVPFESMEEMSRKWGGECRLLRLNSIYGHDAFLKLAPEIACSIDDFLGAGER